MDKISFTPIGYAETPHKTPKETPIQPVYCKDFTGRIIIKEEYADGLLDLEGFNYIHIIFYFHKAKDARLRVIPYLDDKLRGVFATRAPCRPNPIGMSIVKLISREDNILNVLEIDLLDGTPILDIKPYMTDFEYRADVLEGWRDSVKEEDAKRRAMRSYKS
jgi:tRNA-Thr(GGU) m(6)t(6)A37 methyltransferase TsaA